MPRPSPLPIAIVITRFHPGGTERQMIELIRRLDRSRWQVHVACVAAEGAWRDRVLDAAVSVTEFPLTSFRHPSIVGHIQRFAAWCRAKRLAVVHTSDLYMNVFAQPGAALAHVPVRIANRREINPGKSAGLLALQRMSYSCAHRIVTNARAGAERLLRERVPAHRIAVIPNGLDVDRFERAPARSPRRRIAMVANLRPEKGHDVLIDAAADVLRACPDASFDIVGDGPCRGALVARAIERGVAPAFTFRGHCEDVPARLAAADLFVLPSRSEAFPNAVLEAMASGLPVVASDVGGIGEVVRHGQTGLLVPPGRPEPLAAALVDLMRAPARAQSIADAARLDVRARYSFDRMVTAFDRLYTYEASRRGLASWPAATLAVS